MDRGILLLAWGKDGYGYSAYNLANSLKRFSPDIPITLFHSQEVVSKIDLSPFDNCVLIDGTDDPASLKIKMYELSPYKHTLYIDVDSLCLQDINPLFDELEADERPFRIHVFTYYTHLDDRVMPEMVWAYRDDIWDWFMLEDHEFPATQSSIQYFRKCDEVEQFFTDLQANYANPLPLEKLRNKWGGTQPDELYYNVTIAQHRWKPDIGEKMFFGHRYTKKLEQIEKEYYFLSMFGGKRFTSPIYARGYDDRVIKNGRAVGRSYYKNQFIARDKHANRSTPLHRAEERRKERKAARMAQSNIEVKPMKGKIRLLTSWYQTDQRRQGELNQCLINNVNSPINEIYIFTTDKKACGEVVQSDKIRYIENERPTYQDFLEHQGKEYNIIANSDIYYDNQIELIKQCDFEKKVFCLARYDVVNGKTRIFDAHNGKRQWGWSQDSWIWKGKISVDNVDFVLGKPGCDNKFAWHLSHSGYQVFNPAKDLKSYHLHQSGLRTYTQDDRLEPPYLPVQITNIAPHLKQRLLIKQPGKVGDILICLPIAKYYSEKYMVEWECPEQYHYLFDYVDYVTPVVRHKGHYGKVVDMSFGLVQNTVLQKWWLKNRDNYNSFITAKYEIAQVPIELYRNLEYDRKEEREQALMDIAVPSAIRKGYAIVHPGSDDGTQTTIETDLPQVIFEPIEDYSIFDWRKVIENAKEIHCIDSSLINFVDTLDVKADLYYHPTDRDVYDWNNTILKKKWHSPTSSQATS